MAEKINQVAREPPMIKELVPGSKDFYNPQQVLYTGARLGPRAREQCDLREQATVTLGYRYCDLRELATVTLGYPLL